jgi:hypothetical protein
VKGRPLKDIARESKSKDASSGQSAKSPDFRFAMGERVRLLVTADPTGVEGVIVGRIQALRGCDRFIIDRPLRNGEMQEHLVVDVSRLSTVRDQHSEMNIRDATRILNGGSSSVPHKASRYQMLAAQAPKFKFELGQRVQIMITNQVGIIVSRVQHLTGCNRYNLAIGPGKDEKPKSVEMEVVSEHLLFGVEGENLMHLTEGESIAPGGPIEFQKPFPSRL